MRFMQSKNGRLILSLKQIIDGTEVRVFQRLPGGFIEINGHEINDNDTLFFNKMNMTETIDFLTQARLVPYQYVTPSININQAH